MNAKSLRLILPESTTEYARFGRGKRALILIPGLSDGLATVRGRAAGLAWAYRLFSKDYTVYVFSRSNEMTVGSSMADMANELERAMRALGIERADVIGVSQGGMIAQLLAARHPERVGKLILAVTAPRVNDCVRPNAAKWGEMARRGDHKALMISTAENSYTEKRLKMLRPFYPLFGHIGKPKNYERFFANLDAILNFDATEEVKKLSCPTLILGGEEDKTVGAQGSRELHELIAGSELYIYPGYGHAVFEEAKDFNARMLEFLKK